MSKQETDERVRQSKRVEAITGKWWCATGHHMARGEKLNKNGRAMCESCKERIRKAMQR